MRVCLTVFHSGLGGFLLAYSPLIITFMGWRGSGGDGAATVGTLYYMGGLLAILASIGEWVLGNTFPSTFFGVYGGFFLFYGATLTPSYGAYSTFASSPDAPLTGTMNPEFLASVGFVAVFMSIFSFYSTLCALRVNVLFTMAFGLLTVAFGIFAGAEFKGAEGDAATRSSYLVAAGAVGFPVLVIGWYLLLVIMLGSVDFPINLPVGDLSTIIKGGSEIAKAKKEKAARNGAA